MKSDQVRQLLSVSLISVLLAPGVSQDVPLTIAPANMVIIFQVLSKGEHLILHGVLPILGFMLLGLVAAVIDQRLSFRKTKRP